MPDSFVEYMKLNKYKNLYGDLVDDVDNCVMYGSQVSIRWSISKLVSNKCNIPCDMYLIDNNDKYHLAKRDGTKGFYGYNTHYG